MSQLSVNSFKDLLASQLSKVSDEFGLGESNYDRGIAFQRWVARLISDAERNWESDSDEAVLVNRDLGADVIFEDTVNRALLVVQCKYNTPNSPANEDEIASFFAKHDSYMSPDWIRAHGSPEAIDRLVDYKDRIEDGWTAEYRFVTTASSNKRKDVLEEQANNRYRDDATVFCELVDFSSLKDYYAKSRSQDQSIPNSVELQLRADSFIVREQPLRTLVAVVKGNSLRDLYKRHKQSLYAFNIRGYLGSRGINKDLISTIEKEPEDFFYFNNGVAAVCTDFDIDPSTRLVTAKKLQIINGAQTVTAIANQDADEKVEVLFRLTETESVSTEKGMNQKIIQYNNSQNLIKLSDFRSNDPIQKYLIEKLNFKSAKGAIPRMHYIPKRSVGKKGEGMGLRLEEAAKIRYSFLHEPTTISASPKSLWTTKEDGGVYEMSFGVDGELLPEWADEDLGMFQFAIAMYYALVSDFKDRGKQNPNLKVLYRLRFHALALAGIYARDHLSSDEYGAIARSSAKFGEVFSAFAPTARLALVTVFQAATDEEQTTFAFVRSTDRWEQIRRLFSVQLAVQ